MKKNILINGYSKSVCKTVAKLVDDNKVESLFWIYHTNNQKNELKKIHNKSILLNNYKLCRMNFDSYLLNDNKVPHNLLKIIMNELTILVDMMSRFETYKAMSFNDKTTYIYSQFKFWYNYLIDKNIKIYFQIDTPHDVYDYIIYLISKYLSIKLVILQQSSFYKSIKNENILMRVITPTSNLSTGEKSLTSKKYLGSSSINFKDIKSAYNLSKKNSAFESRLNLTKNETKSIFVRMYNLFRDETLNYNYIMNNISKINNKLGLLEFKFIRYNIHSQTNNLKNILLKKSIKLSQVKKRFIYFPLQYQPERTSCPEGRDYANQFLTLMQIRNYLNSEIDIIVKEHPKQFASKTIRNQMYRSEFFYNKILSLKNVYFLDTNTNSKEILKNNFIEGVATIKGNIILEAILNKVPAFYFGNTIWDKFKHSNNCSDQKIISKINKLVRSKIKVDNDEIKKNFYKCLEGCFVSVTSIHDEYNSNDQKIFNDIFFRLINK
tara:strand:- start:28548 stop:30026 length:1479 start_codon:yes stop_codon:yes gene_type:complete